MIEEERSHGNARNSLYLPSTPYSMTHLMKPSRIRMAQLQKHMSPEAFTQLREELWELNDPETRKTVLDARAGRGKPIPFEEYLKKHDIKID
jgi:hypothetical protein